MPTLRQLIENGFEVRLQSHAEAILERDFPAALDVLERVLIGFRVPITEIIGSGGGETKGTQRLRRAFRESGWHKRKFEIKKTIDGVERESISHEVDHVRKFETGCLALEIEWNNKDPFFDRDLENFKRLHAEGAISAGIVITRGPSLHAQMWDFVYRFSQDHKIASFADLERLNIFPSRRQKAGIRKRVERKKKPLDFATAWTDSFVSDKYGEATTHWRKLMDRVGRGVGNPCPLLLIGLPASIVSFEEGHGSLVGTKT